MNKLDQHIEKVTSMRESYRLANGLEGTDDEFQERAEVLRDAVGSILNSILDHERGIEGESEGLLNALNEIGEKGLYLKLGRGTLVEFVRAEYAAFPNMHYALNQVYAIEKVLEPLKNGLIPPSVTSDGEIITAALLLESSAPSTIQRVAQMPEFAELTPVEKSVVVSDIANGKSRDKVVKHIREMKQTSLGINGYLIENEDGTTSMVFPTVDNRQVAFIQSSLGKHLDLKQSGFECVFEWAKRIARKITA